MDQVCFNCFKPGHLSIRCPVPSKYTRCFICNRVCETPEDHFWACANKEFVSNYIVQPNTIRPATLVADIKFQTNAPLFVMDGNDPVAITDSPIKIDSNNGLLLAKEKSFKYYHFYPSENNRCVINVMDGTQNVRFSLRHQKDSFFVNKRIRVRENGSVEHRNETVDNQVLPAELTLKVDTERRFNITLFAFQQNFSFEIFRDQVEYLPQESASLECSICYDNMIGQHVKVTPCGHMFCTKCILQALLDKSECPLCRKTVRESALVNIYLRN